MRLKFSRDDPNTYRCCFCVHVRTGTILLGLLQLLGHVLVVGCCILFHLRPDLLQQSCELVEKGETDSSSTELSNDNESQWNYIGHRKLSSDDKFFAMLIFVGSFVITAMMLFGAIRGRAGYLMPFFCLQVFDFCITSLSMVGYFSYIPDIRSWIAMQRCFPFKEQLLSWDADWLMLVAVTFFVLVMTLKAYFIGVVWACYKYLQNNTAGSVTLRRADYNSAEDSEMLLPPKYEDAILQAENEPAPPAYQP